MPSLPYIDAEGQTVFEICPNESNEAKFEQVDLSNAESDNPQIDCSSLEIDKTIFSSSPNSSIPLHLRIQDLMLEIDNIKDEMARDDSLSQQISEMHYKIQSIFDHKRNLKTNNPTSKQHSNHENLHVSREKEAIFFTDSQMIRLQSLETRLNNIEHIFGPPLNSGTLSSIKSSGGLVSVLERVDTNLNLLTNEAFLNSSIESIKNVSIESTKKSVELEFSALANLEPVSHIVPHLIKRLESLHSLHSKLENFTSRFEDFTEESKRLGSIAAILTESQKTLEKSIEDNQRIISGNMKALEEMVKGHE